MKLNHMNLVVDDVPAARAFLERFFGLRAVGDGHKNFVILLDEDGFALTLMGVGRDNAVGYPKTFHIGFIQPDNAHVDAINQRLKADGVDVGPPSEQHGAWSFSCNAPGGFTIVVRSAVDWQAGEQAGAAEGSHRHRHHVGGTPYQ
jgi:lactoylglutathione lyase